MTTDTLELYDHKQNCDLASAEGKSACIMPSDSNFAEGKAEYPPMHKGKQHHEELLQVAILEFSILDTKFPLS